MHMKGHVLKVVVRGSLVAKLPIYQPHRRAKNRRATSFFSFLFPSMKLPPLARPGTTGMDIYIYTYIHIYMNFFQFPFLHIFWSNNFSTCWISLHFPSSPQTVGFPDMSSIATEETFSGLKHWFCFIFMISPVFLAGFLLPPNTET